MKKSIIVAGILLSSISSAFAEGGNGSHGGGALYCTRPNGTHYTQFLDLFEAEQGTNPFQQVWTIARSDVSADTQLEAAIRNFETKTGRTDLAEKIRTIAAGLPSKMRTIPEGTQLPFPVDTKIHLLHGVPDHCVPRGIGNYDDAQDILEYDPVLLAAMGQTDLAAFRFHEAYFKMQRMSPLHLFYSTSARIMTGSVFSVENIKVESPFVMQTKAKYVCSATGFQVYVSVEKDGSSTFDFTKIRGYQPVDRMWASFSSAALKERITAVGWDLKRMKSNKEQRKTIRDVGRTKVFEEVSQLQSNFEVNARVSIELQDQIDHCSVKNPDCKYDFALINTYVQNAKLWINIGDSIQANLSCSTIE